MQERYLRLPEVRARIPLSKSMIYLLVSRGELAAPIMLGARARAWRESDVNAYLASREQAGKQREASK